MATGMNTAEARRRVRVAQFAGLGLGVMAAALWALDVPGLGKGLPEKPVLPVESRGSGPVIAALPQIDKDASAGIGERLDMAANRPVKPPEAAPKVVEGTPPPAPSGTPWKYLGPIQEATRIRALVSIDGSQKIVSEGSTIAIKTPGAEGRPEAVNYRATVKAITPDYVEIQEDQGARKIERQGRTAKVAWVRNMPTTTAGASMAGGGLSPEARARLIAQGIDPQQAERARQAAMAAMPGRARGMPEGAVAATPNATPASRVIELQGKASPMGSKRGSATGSATGAQPNTGGIDKADSDNAAIKKEDSQPEIHR